MKTCKGMYGIPQAGKLANNPLRKILATCGYIECTHTPGLWQHVWRPISFTLVIDYYGVKFIGVQHLRRLIASLEFL